MGMVAFPKLAAPRGVHLGDRHELDLRHARQRPQVRNGALTTAEKSEPRRSHFPKTSLNRPSMNRCTSVRACCGVFCPATTAFSAGLSWRT